MKKVRRITGDIVGLLFGPALAWLAVYGDSAAAENLLPFYYAVGGMIGAVFTLAVQKWEEDRDIEALAGYLDENPRAASWLRSSLRLGRVFVMVAAASQGWYWTATIVFLNTAIAEWFTITTREARATLEYLREVQA